VVLADRGGGAAERVQGAQEAAVGLVLPGDGAVTLPARPAQLVERPVVAGPRVRVRLDHGAGREGAIRQRGPRARVLRVAGGHLDGVDAGVEGLAGLGVLRQFGRGRAAEQILGHAGHRKWPRRRRRNPGPMPPTSAVGYPAGSGSRSGSGRL
jgi:hypothetical protein